MKKHFTASFFLSACLLASPYISPITAQSLSDLNDDDLFGGSSTSGSSYSDDDLFGGNIFGGSSSSDDDLFGGSFSEDSLFDDDMFSDDTIEVWNDTGKNKKDLGVIFENGTVKIGGSFDSSASTSTVLYLPQNHLEEENKTSFPDRLRDTTVTPSIGATFTLDARPTQTLRMYTKLNAAYPFQTTVSAGFSGTPPQLSIAVKEYFSMKEMFTDFSVAENIYFRFGLHTVSWGTGYFYSPVSDLINTSSIDPTDVGAGVSGALNLRAQITFPDSMNCLWLYIIPPSLNGTGTAGSFLSAIDGLKYPDVTPEKKTQLYLRDIGFAAKGDFVLGGWELGAGAVYKYESAPKALLTASGSIIHGKVSVFGEAVYQYGSSSEWIYEPNWENKTNIFQATAGAMYTWANPGITVAAQYYFDGNDADAAHRYFTCGHNIALLASFGKIFGSSNLSAQVFGMVTLNDHSFAEDYPSQSETWKNAGIDIDKLNVPCIIYGNLNYSPFSSLSFSAGPYVTFTDFETAPTVALRLSARLGGGSF